MLATFPTTQSSTDTLFCLAQLFVYIYFRFPSLTTTFVSLHPCTLARFAIFYQSFTKPIMLNVLFTHYTLINFLCISFCVQWALLSAFTVGYICVCCTSLSVFPVHISLYSLYTFLCVHCTHLFVFTELYCLCSLYCTPLSVFSVHPLCVHCKTLSVFTAHPSLCSLYIPLCVHYTLLHVFTAHYGS